MSSDSIFLDFWWLQKNPHVGTQQMESNDFMGGQPTPPNIPPSDIRLIIRPYYGKPMPNNPWIRPYFWGGYMGGGWLTSHNDCPFRFGVIFWFQPCNRYSLVGKNPNWLSRKKPLWHCLIGILISWITRIPTLLGRISSPIYPKQPVSFGSTEVTINLHHQWIRETFPPPVTTRSSNWPKNWKSGLSKCSP